MHLTFSLISALLAVGTPSTLANPLQARAAPLTPGGKKAGSAGGRAVPFLKDHLGWWYDWTPSPGTKSGVVGIPMFWGIGQNGDEDARRFNEYKNGIPQPQYLLTWNEPDCTGRDTSANMNIKDGYQKWNQYVAPYGDKGALLGSPAMCLQKDEAWLKRFVQKPLDHQFDFTAIHVYKPDMDGVRADIDYYWKTYGKPIWVTEFACVYDQNNFKACEDQGQINQWIRDVVDLFQGDDRVRAYAYTDGGGLGKAWLPTNSAGTALSESGRTYLNAISKYA
ncbi:uncharacterized protein RCC_06132 [Ramularia collo-cygni]|uniref:Asl1-like glycosyl hydrolase catalytic domain-containing protein n=1 Tax=Ramularia collo-cygni TaxID=112498 RepID=A0A2D3VC19_9PEZI|nr:uncharacterized protein RCC_06132 [Ramularia collo-cygni]CZT20274.1 uncharacterized protein RCC_06132 [Ramularia collo-cygni]